LIRAGLAFAVALGFVGATAAELPQRPDKPKSSKTKARTCFINGAPGVETPGGGCIRVSGYISSQGSIGGVKH
jgi:hypothetical protein